MNRIIVSNNILDNYKDDGIEIIDNRIIFKGDGDYNLEYVNSNNIDINIEVLDNINIKLFISSCNNDLKVKENYRLGKKSNLVLYKFYYNKKVLEDVIIDLDGEDSLISYNFSSISSSLEEYHIVVNHNNHRVNSYISNKCVGLNNSNISLVIDSKLDKGNKDCVMDQTSRILTLGDVESRIVPNMFIEDNSVAAKHGSVIGRIREEELFYFLSRGINEREAVNLIVKGFILSNLDVDMESRALIFKILQDLNI